MPARDLPTLDQVNDLPPEFSLVAPPEYEDFNGHVNVSHHYALHMRACEGALATLGVTPEVIAAGFTVFSAEHHLTYLNEIRIGDTIEGRTRLLSRTAKTVHGVSILTDTTTGLIASLCEWIEIAIDLNARRSIPFTDGIVAKFDARIAHDTALPWTLPAAGPMGVNR